MGPLIAPDSNSVLSLAQALGVEMLRDDVSAAFAAAEAGRPITLLGKTTLVQTGMRLLERYGVQLARENGATWDQIGLALGVSRQAARKRYPDVR